MAEDDIAFLLNRRELVEPHENEQAEVNTIVDKSKVKECIDEQKKKKYTVKLVYKTSIIFINTESVFLKMFSLFS